MTRNVISENAAMPISRVLVVDDEPINGLLLKLNLEDLGYQVVLAKDGVEAVAQVKADSFDLVLMDVMMPRMNGLDATRNILALHPELPIIGITADDTNAMHRDCLDAGMRACLLKPLEMPRLLAAIDALGS